MKVEIVDVSTLIDCIWDALFSFHVYHTPSFYCSDILLVRQSHMLYNRSRKEANKMEHKKMADYAYHYGLKVRIYPSQQQKEMIRRNADAARCVYN
ncbi:helix-turn-helix domain-containing protein, partial [uncultured Mitsuokella sp.]|uniref:helix-turn-helix domain-containing protein n=1 Tax=uncultured Mitsuokella sp. TaxID=453120 RepID=UPI0034C6D865